MRDTHSVLLQGIRDGIPIALGYFAVSFSLGIAMRNAGLTSLQGFFLSMTNMASAGEYADIQIIAANGTYFEMALATLVANARYLLMSTALAQRFDRKTPFFHRLFVGYGVTDEIFGITISRPGPVQPSYPYGALLVAVPAWSFGTAIGIAAGNILPLRAVSALSVALYGMFLAIIIPPSVKDKAVAVAVIAAFIMSALAPHLPLLSSFSSGTRTIILTVVIASAAAAVKPHKEEKEEENDA